MHKIHRLSQGLLTKLVYGVNFTVGKNNKFWQDKLQKKDKTFQILMRDILLENSSKKRINEINFKLTQLLSFNRKTLVSVEDAILILVAIKQSSYQKLQNHCKKVIDLIVVNYQMENQPEQAYFESESVDLDPIMIMALAEEIKASLQEETNKNRKMKFKLKLIRIFETNSQKITQFSQAFKFLRIVSEMYSHNLLLDRLRFLRTFRCLEKIIFDFLGREEIIIVSQNEPLKEEGIAVLKKEQFQIILKMIRHFNLSQKKSVQILVNLVKNHEKSLSADLPFEQRINILFQTYRSLAARPFTNQKKELLQFLCEFCKREKIAERFLNLHKTQLYLIYDGIFSAAFDLAFWNTPKEKIHNFTVIRKSDLKPPQVDINTWKNVILPIKNNHNHIYFRAIKKIYPSQLNNIGQDQPEKRIVFKGTIDNEPILRILEALKELNLNFIKEPQIFNRTVDFLLDDNIIVEFDGDLHIDYSTMEINQKTGFRNMMLLSLGYKLLIIDIFQYNEYRSTEKLKSLLSQKLEILKSENICYII